MPKLPSRDKKEVKDEGLDFISILLFIPVGLIRLICNLIKIAVNLKYIMC